MGADSSRLFSPTEDEDPFYSRSARFFSERIETTSTTVDIGFPTRADSIPKDDDLNVLHQMVRMSVDQP